MRVMIFLLMVLGVSASFAGTFPEEYVISPSPE